MSATEWILTTARTQIEDMQATARIWRCYSDLLVSRSAILYPAFSNEPERSLYRNALKDSRTDSSALYRGLIIQLNSVLEGYIRGLVGVFVDEKCSAAENYEDLDENLKLEHIVYSAKVLAYLKIGTVNGIRHDFQQTQKNLADCLVGSKGYKLNKEVFTLLMGNCTPDRVETLFENLGIGSPFDDALGENKLLQKWAGDNKKRRVATAARDELSRQIGVRNEIVHGNVSKSLSQTDFDTASDFFFALIDGLDDVANKSL
jgi:hypothetical protein